MPACHPSALKKIQDGHQIFVTNFCPCMPPTKNILCVFSDEVFLPKSESDMEGGEMDEFEKELEEFKR